MLIGRMIATDIVGQGDKSLTETVGATSVTGAEKTLLISRFVTRGVCFLAGLTVVYVIQIFRLGPTHRYVFIVLGSMCSILILLSYASYAAHGCGQIRHTKATPVGFITRFGDPIPYLFGYYLLFYEGFWKGWSLIDSFSWGSMIIRLVYILGGYAVVSGVYKLSEFVRAVDEGHLKTN